MRRLLFALALMLPLTSPAQIVLDGNCLDEDFTAKDHKTQVHYFGFCEADGTVSILDPKSKSWFTGYCQDEDLKATDPKTGQKITGTCTIGF